MKEEARALILHGLFYTSSPIEGTKVYTQPMQIRKTRQLSALSMFIPATSRKKTYRGASIKDVSMRGVTTMGTEVKVNRDAPFKY